MGWRGSIYREKFGYPVLTWPAPRRPGSWGSCVRSCEGWCRRSPDHLCSPSLALSGGHFLHPEDKSLSPDGEFCSAYTRGLLLRRPIEPITPLIPIGKEIERRSQEGEDISVFDNAGPVKYYPRKTVNTRPAEAALIQRASRFSKKLLRRASRVSQHAIDRFHDGDRIHPGTRKKLAQTVEELER